MVIGGGPAGLEAARVAASRGHRVTLLEREADLGGRLRRIHEVPFFEEMKNLLEFLVPQARASGADIRCGVEASAEMILDAAPDDVIIAAGATPLVPDITTDGSVPVVTTDDHIALDDIAGRKIIIIDEDGYYWTSAVTESAIACGGVPIVVSRVFEVCREIPMVSRIEYLRQLDRNRGRAVANSFVSEVANGGVVLRHYMTGREKRIEDVAGVVWVGAARPNSEIASELRDAGMDKHRIHLVGDAFAPRRLANALTEAHAAARRIGSPARN